MPIAGPTYNLAVLYPHLMVEWDPENVVDPQTVAPFSGIKRKWVCKDGHRWDTAPVNRTKVGCGCPYCAGYRATEEHSIAVTHPELAAQWGDNQNPASAYSRGSDYKAHWKCPVVPEHSWRATVSSRIAGAGCPQCSGRTPTATHNLAAVRPDLVAEWGPGNVCDPNDLSPYTHRVVNWRCRVGHEWTTAVYCRTLNGSGCPYCVGSYPTDTTSLAALRPDLTAEWGSSNDRRPGDVLPGSDYVASWACLKNVGHPNWRASVYRRHKKNLGCPKCRKMTSRAESEVLNFVRSLGFPDAGRTRKVISPKEIDVWVPSRGVGIEYDGLIWHSEAFKTAKKQVEKWRACRAHGIRLVTVSESDWLWRRSAVEGYLKSVLGVCTETHGARTLGMTVPVLSEVSNFLEAHHVAGVAVMQGAWIRGLSYQDGLVAVMVCRRERDRGRPSAPPRWTLSRYCVASGTKVIGGFARLWKAFLREIGPESVTTFSDRRWSNGELYQRHGFRHDGEVRQSYWYFNTKERRLHHKARFQKKRLASHGIEILPGETEKAAMQRHRWYRVYDLGLDRWVWTP